MVSILRLFLQIFKMKSSQKESIKNQPRQPFSLSTADGQSVAARKIRLSSVRP